MRESCLDCVRKHLAQASVLIDESRLGYPHHRWLAIGHLAEAESESLREYPALSVKIRASRLEYMSHNDMPNHLLPCVEELIREACVVAGDMASLADDPRNSKSFAIIAPYADAVMPGLAGD